MPWIKTGHECRLPNPNGPWWPLFLPRPLGSVWECGTCGRQWEVVEQEVGLQSFRTLRALDGPSS